ncbi:MAG: hypothetical protein ACYT04_77315, partial [Nostoc sp.]
VAEVIASISGGRGVAHGCVTLPKPARVVITVQKKKLLLKSGGYYHCYHYTPSHTSTRQT